MKFSYGKFSFELDEGVMIFIILAGVAVAMLAALIVGGS